MRDFEKATKLLDKNPKQALKIYNRMLKQGYVYKEIYNNCATAFRILDDDSNAYEMCVKALDPAVPFMNGTFMEDYPVALNNLGLLAARYENDVMARELLELALLTDPNYEEAKWNLSNCLLRMYCSNKYDNLLRCWELYDARFTKNVNPVKFEGSLKSIKRWDGRPGVKVCILAEQGLGDQIMFGRYLKLIPNEIVVQCTDKMSELFSDYNRCLDPASTDCEYGIGICSLGRIFNEYIPEGDWLRTRYKGKTPNGVLDIGCAWSGNPSHPNNKYRSCSSDNFRSFAAFGNLYTVNPTENGTSGFTALNVDGWNNTIEALSRLDVVVCVDTSIAHLCGSLGMKCLMLTQLKGADWRWGDRSMSTGNKWYSSVKVIRNDGSWESAINGVKVELTKLQNGIW